MKSVVVEASTVAKAIEMAWQKAEKPEEFFIRVLQEHNSGFLGFGAQKAKIAFFFKNVKKADTLFPTVLKQKEYVSFFDNEKIKTPSQSNIIDNETNRNVSLGVHNKPGHGKQKSNHPQPRKATPDAKHQPKAAAPVQIKQPHQQLHTKKTQVVLDIPAKSLPVKQDLHIQKDVAVKKNIVTQQEQQKKIKANKAPVKKTPQIIEHRVAAPKTSVLQQIEEIIKPQAISSASTTTPRVMPKFKRRPLLGADQSISGITKSTPKSPVVATTAEDKASDEKGKKE